MQDGRHAEAARRTSMDRTHDDLAFVAGQRSRLRASAKRRKLPSGPLPSLRVTKSAGALPGLSGPLSAGPAFPPGGKMSRAVGGRAALRVQAKRTSAPSSRNRHTRAPKTRTRSSQPAAMEDQTAPG